ncbi:MFS transporter [Bifidobacterium dolichotidis]|nr:MFS transporter [Bifidobacterium dolichotidis]
MSKSSIEVLRYTIGFALFSACTAVPWIMLSTITLPKTLELMDSAHKIGLLGALNSVGAAVALVANIVFGALSDLTRSRFGKRTPWILGGTAVTAVSFAAAGYCHTVAGVFALYCCAQVGFNMLLAPFIAIMSDRVSEKKRGTVSSFYGAGSAVGNTMGTFVGSLMLAKGAQGLRPSWLLAAAFIVAVGFGITLFIFPKEESSVNEPRKQLTVKSLLLTLCPPRNAPDFYLALFGRLLMLSGYCMVTTYQLFICQDFILAGRADAQTKALQIVSAMAVITLITALISAAVAGVITDRLNMRKLPVAFASVLFAAGTAIPLFIHSEIGMYLFAVVAGLGYGVYNAIDQALNIAVLPNKADAGKDLGILNLANTMSTVVGSILTTGVISMVTKFTHSSTTPGAAYVCVFIVSIAVVMVASAIIMRIRSVK